MCTKKKKKKKKEKKSEATFCEKNEQVESRLFANARRVYDDYASFLRDRTYSAFTDVELSYCS